MIKYELEKKLKDAGFPMKDGIVCTNCYTGIILHGASSEKYGRCPVCECDTLKVILKGTVPTLSELIEACGENFYSIWKRDNGEWRAAHEKEGNYFIVGQTPEEAVANLWLELNKK